jgi:CheY-like chemotaxis protein
MDGLKLAHAVRNRWPPVEIIMMSGKSRPNDDDLPARGMFFSKPVDGRLLRQTFRKTVPQADNTVDTDTTRLFRQDRS